MKILLVNSWYAPNSVGGADISTRKLANELSKRNLDIEVLTCDKHDFDDYVDEILVHRRKFENIDSWCNYHSLKGLKKILYKSLDYYNFRNKKTITKLLNEIKPDIIHTNNVNGISPIIWRVSKKLNIPVIHTCRDYHLLCHKTTLVNRNGQTCNNPTILCKIYRFFYRISSKNVNVCTAPSQYTLNQFINLEYFQNARNAVIFNAIDYKLELVKGLLEKRTSRTRNSFKIIFLGALEKHKGIDVLLEAFKEIKNDDLVLYIAGKGSFEKEIVNASKKDNRIKYLGFLDKNDLQMYLEDSDVLVCPSNWQEPFGRVIIDAYKVAMPVIVSDIGGLSEIVNSDTGIKIQPGSVLELRNAIIILFNDRNLYKNLCIGASQYIVQFSIERQADLFCEQYLEMIGRN